MMASMRPDPSHQAPSVAHWPSSTRWDRQQQSEGQRSDRSTAPIGLSIVIPAKNEAPALPQLIDEIATAFRELCRRSDDQGHRLEQFEILVVDDVSTDQTPQVLQALTTQYPELRPLRLAPPGGQSSALSAGFWEARGTYVATLDADLQNDPADLAKLWDQLPGADAILGWRTTREDVWLKRFISKWANRARNAALGQQIRDTGCAVRIFPRDVALRFPMFQGVHRFFGPLLIREGCTIRQAPVSHRPRPHGRSHYNLWNRSLKVIVDLLGVVWLMRRPVRYQLECPDHPPSVPASNPVSSSTSSAA